VEFLVETGLLAAIAEVRPDSRVAVTVKELCAAISNCQKLSNNSD
jgi:hypothetical protein